MVRKNEDLVQKDSKEERPPRKEKPRVTPYPIRGDIEPEVKK